MLLNFIKVVYREDLLLKKYLELVESGVKTSEILVLLQNSALKKKFTNDVLKNIRINAVEKFEIHSFFSLVYNTLVDNWCFIENSIPSDKSFILPNLVGLEVSQFLLKDILPSIVRLGFGTMTGAIVYFVLCYLFKLEEVVEMKNLVLNKLKK